MTRSVVAILRCRFSQKLVAVRRDNGIKPIEGLSQAGKIVKRTHPSKHRPGGNSSGNRLGPLTDSSIRFHKMHCSHAGVVGDARKSI